MILAGLRLLLPSHSIVPRWRMTGAPVAEVARIGWTGQIALLSGAARGILRGQSVVRRVTGRWSSGLTHHPFKVKITGSNPVRPTKLDKIQNLRVAVRSGPVTRPDPIPQYGQPLRRPQMLGRARVRRSQPPPGQLPPFYGPTLAFNLDQLGAADLVQGVASQSSTWDAALEQTATARRSAWSRPIGY